MVNVELEPKEIQLIHYLAGLATGKLSETEHGKKLIEYEVFPLLKKLNKSIGKKAEWTAKIRK